MLGIYIADGKILGKTKKKKKTKKERDLKAKKGPNAYGLLWDE